VTHAVLSPVSPATLWICVVSIASARGIAGRMVVSRRASLDGPIPTERELRPPGAPDQLKPLPRSPTPEGRLTRAAGLLLARMSAGPFSIERTPMGWADASHAVALVLAALVGSISAGAICRRSRTPRRTPNPKSLGLWPSLEFTRRQLPHGGRFSNNHDNDY
jgi:hypothetical protein